MVNRNSTTAVVKLRSSKSGTCRCRKSESLPDKLPPQDSHQSEYAATEQQQ